MLGSKDEWSQKGLCQSRVVKGVREEVGLKSKRLWRNLQGLQSKLSVNEFMATFGTRQPFTKHCTLSLLPLRHAVLGIKEYLRNVWPSLDYRTK
jgi:hypothetical protein